MTRALVLENYRRLTAEMSRLASVMPSPTRAWPATQSPMAGHKPAQPKPYTILVSQGF